MSGRKDRVIEQININCAQALIDILRLALGEGEVRREKIVFWSIHPGLERMVHVAERELMWP